MSLSGDIIKIDNGMVLKSRYSTSIDRWNANINKQLFWQSPYVNAVNIISKGDGYVSMPYINNADVFTAFCVLNTIQIHTIKDKLIGHIEDCIQHSVLKPFNVNAWQSKLIELKSKINDPCIDKLLSIDTSLPLYEGKCHGDFSMSNLLFKHADIYAIDFLSTFYESPLQDIVKLRQDTAYHFINKQQDNYKLKPLLSFKIIDAALQHIIDNDPYLSHYYKYFMMLNFLRILPYAQNDKIIKYIEHVIYLLGENL